VSTFIIPCDISVESEVTVSLDEVVEEWGRIDYAVNCAGTSG
jgi:NAD(P)-dependent dehydrogenase (short-subunit alcohol dehydrogenase family)